MSKWSEIYRKQMSEFASLDGFIENKLAYKRKLIDVIQKYGSNHRTVLEAGSGSGVTSVWLAKRGYFVIGIDSDPDMISLSRSIASDQKTSIDFRQDDIRTLLSINDRFDVIFSNGVMEHFSDKEIVGIVNKHLSMSDSVIISVPSDYFSDDQRLHGDERFMSVKAWRKVLAGCTGHIVEEFSFNSNMPVSLKAQFIGFVLKSS